MSTQPIWVIAAVSKQHGVEAWLMYSRPINSAMFSKIIDEIKENGDRFVMFGDNCSIHKSKKTIKIIKQKKTEIIFNIPYMPILNPIERVFSIIKNKYKRLKMNRYQNNQKLDTVDLIEDAMESLN